VIGLKEKLAASKGRIKLWKRRIEDYFCPDIKLAFGRIFLCKKCY
jgi:hypothetical protein